MAKNNEKEIEKNSETVNVTDTSETPAIPTHDIDLTGTWLVYFGIAGVVEGSRIITLNGTFAAETFLGELSGQIYDSLGERAKAAIDNSGNGLVIKNMCKLS